MQGSVLLLANLTATCTSILAAASVLICHAAAAGTSSVCGGFPQLPGPVSCQKGLLSGPVTHQACICSPLSGLLKQMSPRPMPLHRQTTAAREASVGVVLITIIIVTIIIIIVVMKGEEGVAGGQKLVQ